MPIEILWEEPKDLKEAKMTKAETYKGAVMGETSYQGGK